MKWMLCGLLILASCLFQVVLAQPPDVDWLRTYGSSDVDYFEDACPTPDHGFLVASTIMSTRGVVLTKTNAQGDVQWTRSYSAEILRFCSTVHSVPSGGYILAGAITGPDYGDRLVLFKVSEQGDSLWRFVAAENRYPEISGMEPTPDGGNIMSGFIMVNPPVTSAALLIKVDANGQQQWQRVYGGTQYEKFGAVLNAPAGGYIAVGSTHSASLWIVRLTANGDSLWNRYLELPVYDDFAGAVLTPDGGLAVAGTLYISRNLDWYMGERFLAKFDSVGNSLWTRQYMTNVEMNCTHLAGTHDGGFIISGEYGLLRTNERGDSLWCLPTSSDYCGQLPDHSFLLAGTMGNNDQDVFLLKTDPEPSAAHDPASIATSFALLPNYPNPFNAVTTIPFELSHAGKTTISLYDVNGRLLRTLADGQFSAGSHTIRLDAQDLPSGIYFCRMKAGSYSASQKMVLLK